MHCKFVQCSGAILSSVGVNLQFRTKDFIALKEDLGSLELARAFSLSPLKTCRRAGVLCSLSAIQVTLRLNTVKTTFASLEAKHVPMRRVLHHLQRNSAMLVAFPSVIYPTIRTRLLLFQIKHTFHIV